MQRYLRILTPMNNKLVVVVALLCIALISCKRESLVKDDTSVSDNPSEQNIAAKDLVAPAGFDFKTEKQLTVRVKVADAIAGTRYGIKIYADVPSTGKLISSGATDNTGEYTNTLTVPAWLEHIYIEKTNPDGNSTFEKVAANQFTAAVFKSAGNSFSKPYLMRKTGSNLDCTSGCTSIINNPTGSYNVPTGDTICFTGTLTNVTLTVQANAVAKICGSGDITYLSIAGQLIVLENAIIKVQSSNYMNGETINWSDSLVFDHNVYMRSFVNNGKFYSKSFETGVLLTNNGRFIVDGDYQLRSYSNNSYNNGYFKTTGNATFPSISRFYNNCIMDIGDRLAMFGEFYMNNAYAKVGGYFWVGSTVGSGVHHTQYTLRVSVSNNSTVEATHLITRNHGVLTGTAESRIKISSTSNFVNGSVSGVKICDANGIENNPANIHSSVFTCNGTIPVSACNPVGFGIVGSDADSDGIDDNIDEYPNDATRAFNSYYPSENATATIAFEDLWPSLADYDFNDLVVAFNIQQVISPDNKVVDYKVKLKVKAIGGSYINGLGFQLNDLTPSEISTITGQVLTQNFITRNANNTEASQSKAVVICFDSPEPLISRVGGSMFNTVKTNNTGTSDTMHINIHFTTPILPTRLTTDKFNPFIFTNKRRGYEIHMVNYVPTDLVNTSLFRTMDDRSYPSLDDYYRTRNGLPWAMIIPEDFVYPKEKAAITSAYNFFDDWVYSGGSSNTNWFTNIAGNRNEAEVY